jgi:anti-sigma regulatory factor (Ser/Thr protein kinase)
MSADEPEFERSFRIEGGNFSKAGRASADVKKILREVGLAPEVIRRLAIACYEAEMNVVAYAREGAMTLTIHPARVRLVVADRGPGIADIELAMQEGYSTASDAIREMGFGAGMGLPNIKKNVDRMTLTSQVGEGTTLDVEVDFA